MNLMVFAELMLLGFISLLLTVFQGTIVKICVSESITEHLLPCPLSSKPSDNNSSSPHTTSHLGRLLDEQQSEDEGGFCAAKVTPFTYILLVISFGIPTIVHWYLPKVTGNIPQLLNAIIVCVIDSQLFPLLFHVCRVKFRCCPLKLFIICISLSSSWPLCMLHFLF